MDDGLEADCEEEMEVLRPERNDDIAELERFMAGLEVGKVPLIDRIITISFTKNILHVVHWNTHPNHQNQTQKQWLRGCIRFRHSAHGLLLVKLYM